MIQKMGIFGSSPSKLNEVELESKLLGLVAVFVHTRLGLLLRL